MTLVAWHRGSLQMRFALIVAVAVLCLCVVAGAIAHHLTRQRAASDSLGTPGAATS
jgi:hypothetical protein